MRRFIITFSLAAVLSSGFVLAAKKRSSAWYEDAVKNAATQMDLQIKAIEANPDVFFNPVTTKANRYSTACCKKSDWRSGFFPGSMWYLYELTGDKSLLPLAKKYTEAITEAKYHTRNHDVGFMVNCSFGNGRRFINKEAYDSVLVTAAKSLCTRFKPDAGIIQSWNVKPGSSYERKAWICPVIIDNMMNLELLFEATKISGDSTYYKVAVSHADNTLKEHFRPDGSCYHVIDYDPMTGKVRHRMTQQGYADESSWARGQAWAIYGFTMCYRETGDTRYLDRAVKTFEYMRDNKNMPEDKVPYWDMDAPDIPNEPRDVSSAAIIASALYELSGYPVKNGAALRKYADEIMASLASEEYTARPGENGRFILKHSTGNLPGNSEIDVPLNYADYYYLEALKRKRDLSK